jgi:hypothetical protein
MAPKRPEFRSHLPDADQYHAEANNQRLEHIMTLLERIIKILNKGKRRGS